MYSYAYVLFYCAQSRFSTHTSLQEGSLGLPVDMSVTSSMLSGRGGGGGGGGGGAENDVHVLPNITTDDSQDDEHKFELMSPKNVQEIGYEVGRLYSTHTRAYKCIALCCIIS